MTAKYGVLQETGRVDGNYPLQNDFGRNNGVYLR